MAHTAEAEEAFARIEGDIAHKLKAAFVLRDRPDKTFLPVEKAKEILLEFMIHELMELCKCAGDDSIEHDQEPSSVARILAMDEQQKDYTCLVLAILLCIDKFSLVHWMQFRKYLDRSSTSLPLGSEEVYQAFGFDIGQRFYEEQFAFCPISLEEHRVNNYTRIKSRCKMPYLEEVKIGSGSFGTVYKIKIPRGHLQGTYYNTTTLARKDFEIAGRGRENFDQEWETMEHILQAKGLHDNIMRTYAGLKLDSQLSIFYPLAKCNLAEYLKNHQDFSSSICDRLLASGAESHRAKRELFIQVRDLAEALKSLHDFSSKDSTMASCFHMDLKPENILVCTDHNGSEIWKISDFGISRVEKIEDKARNVRTTLNLDKVFNRILNYSKELKQVTAPGGGGTYIAPEALYPESKVTTKCDVWSLACIVLMVMSFTHGGPEEVKSFQKKLAEHGKGSDWFFVTKDIRKFSLPFALKKTYKGQDENGEPTRYMQNPHIEECLHKWSSSTEKICKEFYRKISKLLLDDALLPDPERRIDASTFSNSFSNYLSDHFPYLYDRSSENKFWTSHGFSALQEVAVAHTILNSLTTSGLTEFLAFIAPSEFHVYRTPHKAILTHRRPPPETTWSHCALSHDLLCIAMDSAEKSFRCQIVSLSMIPAEISRSQPIPGCIDLVRPTYGHIKMCAVSPDSMFLAFVTEEPGKFNGFRVHLFAQDELCRAGASVERNKLWQNFQIVECARAVRLQFSPDGHYLHAVFVLQPGRRSGAKVLIWKVDTGGCVDDSVISDPKGNDNHYGFVTTSQFVGQGRSTGAQVVVLTEGRYLNAIDILRPDSTVRQDLGRAHQAIDFVIDASSGWIFCLAKVGGSNITKVLRSRYPVRAGGKWEWKDITPAGAVVPLDYDASTDSLCFRPESWSDDEKFIAPKIIIATVKGLLLTFDVPDIYSDDSRGHGLSLSAQSTEIT